MTLIARRIQAAATGKQFGDLCENFDQAESPASHPHRRQAALLEGYALTS